MRKKYFYSAAMAAGVITFAAAMPPALAADNGFGHLPDKQDSVRFIDNQGRTVGQATLQSGVGGVLFQIELHDLPPGPHGFHIHETGKCTPLEDFSDAGGHLNISGSAHGLYHDYGAHEGDMENIVIDDDGEAAVDIMNTRVTMDPLSPTGQAFLADKDGSALILHAGPDDYVSQPAGEAGPRIACAVIYGQE